MLRSSPRFWAKRYFSFFCEALRPSERLAAELRDRLAAELRDRLEPEPREPLDLELRDRLDPEFRDRLDPELRDRLPPELFDDFVRWDAISYLLTALRPAG
jgi:hypothetical protein